MTTQKDIAVRCRAIEKHYGTGPARIDALRGVDLDVYRGELLMIVGPSGCGKTTLLSIISAILDQDSGECQVLGRDPASLSPNDRVRFRGDSFGFVFQVFNLLPALTARENVAVPLLIRGEPARNAYERAAAVLESVDLASRMDALPGQLSGGQQQRVAIARSLVHNPKIIVCDEPTGSLDHESGHKMMALLRGVAQHEERTLIVVTHDLRIVEFADRIARMDDGRIVAIDEHGTEELRL